MLDPLARFAPALFAVMRIMAGLLFLEHGLIKVIGFPPGASPGVQPLLSFLGVGGLIEIVTGVLITIGLFTRYAAFIASGEMAVGYFVAHASKGFYPAANGGDGAILFCFMFLYIAAVGGGIYSLDGRRGGGAA